jgi:hypothetical protein
MLDWIKKTDLPKFGPGLGIIATMIEDDHVYYN